MANTSNIKTIKKRVEAIHPTIDSSLETIKNSLTPYNFLEVNENGFNKSNVLKDLANNFNKVPKSAPIGKIGNDVMGNEVQNAYPATPDMLKPGVSIVDVENPTQLITSNNNSNTIATDRADGNKDIKRWITRSIFKFREEDYGFDRQVYEIPVKLLMEGIVGVDGRHSTTLQEYPYPEEIVMISQKTDKNFIHFLNVQYSDSHYNYYRGKPYNLMIVKDRIDYGSVNANGDGFNYYTSVYANNVEESLAFYKDGYLYLSMPDKSFGDELLNTLWDCKIIWRKDAPNREFTIQYDSEELISEENSLLWNQSQTHLSYNRWDCVGYGNGVWVMFAEDTNNAKLAYSTDAINWTESTYPGNTLYATTSGTICYGNSEFVMRVWNDLKYSTNGITWQVVQERPDKDTFSGLFYANGKYVAYTDNQRIYISTNGLQWSKVYDPGSRGWLYGHYYTNNTYFIYSYYQSRSLYSTDGNNWTQYNGSFRRGYSFRDYRENEIIICVDQDGGSMQYSTDGFNFTTSYSGNIPTYPIITHNTKIFMMISTDTVTNKKEVYFSETGIDWNDKAEFPAYQAGAIGYGNEQFIVIPFAKDPDDMTYVYTLYMGYKDNVRNFKNIIKSSELSGKSYLFGETSYLSPNINSISQLNEFTNPLVTNNSISMGLSNNKGSLYRIPNYTTPYDLTFTDELSWSLTNFPNILIPITNKYQLGLNYITGVYSETSVMKNTLYCSLFDNIIHKADPKIKTTGDSNYPCDKLVTNIDSDSHIIKLIPIYSSNIRTDDNNGSIEVMVYATKKKYKVVFTVTDSVLSFTTTAISTFNGFEIADVKQISSTKAILITSTYNVYLDVIKEDSQTANPFGLSGAITPYLLSKYNIVGINASKVVSSLADCSNTSKFASGINNGAIDVVINNSKLSGDGKYFINSGRYSIMKDNADTNYLVHLKEKYTFSSELDAPYSKNFDWIETSNGLSNRMWSSICYGNGKYVAIADNSGTFAYSTDGITWTETSNGLGIREWSSICYGNGKYVVVTIDSTIFAYSTDGITWKETLNGLSASKWQSICYGNGKYVVVAIGSNTFAYSTDGITWTETSNGLSGRQWWSICYGNGKYVAVGYNYGDFAYSTDGITWTEKQMVSGSYRHYSVCYGNGKYVAVADNFNIFAYSTDGINWTKTSNGLSERRWYSICYGNGKYVAVSGYISDSNTFAYSTDGINWTETSNGLSKRYWRSVCYGNDKYVVTSGASDVHDITSNIFAYSDGIII